MNHSAESLKKNLSGGAFPSLINKGNAWFFPLFFFLLNLIIKSFSVTKVSFDLDEAWHTYFSQKSLGEILKIAGTDPNGPFFNLLLHFWIKLYGVSEIATRTLSLIFSAATAPLLFTLGKKYFNTLTGIFGALIFSFSNLHFFFAHNARVYALICFLAALSFLLFFKLIKTQRYTTFIFLILVNTMLLYTHLTTSFFIAAEGIAALLFFSESRKGVLLIILAQVIAGALFLPWILLTPYYHQPAHGIWLHPPEWNEVKMVLYDFCGTENLLNLFIVIFILSLVIRQRSARSSTWKLQLVLLLWFCIPMICSIVVSHTLVPVFMTKYVMTSSLGLFMLIAYSISLLRVSTGIRFIVIAYLLLKLYPTIGSYDFISEDWRTAVREVKKRKTDRTLVIVSPWYMHYPFCYYYNRDYYINTENTLSLLNHERVFFGEKEELILNEPTDYDQVVILTAHEKMRPPESILRHFQNNFLPECDTAFPSIRMYCFKKATTGAFASDMEKPSQSFQPNKIVEKKFAHSGTKVSELSEGSAYSATFEDRVGAFSKQATSVAACGWVYYEDKNTDCVFVISLENKNGSFLYESVRVTKEGTPGKWFRICRRIKIPVQTKPDDIVKVYFWNKTVSPVYVDDMEVVELK
jgi:mannosyltransferase